ncbi:MAG: hypothetical protein HY822_13995 [Acidobacteria bacterium]|nr:hypothetical protein [Acidobacteriota bacterium]
MRPFLAVLAFALAAQAERIPCPVTADTWVAMMPWDAAKPLETEAGQNHGGEAKLVVRGRESFALLAFDCSKLKGHAVRTATLRLWREPDPVPLHTVGLSTLSGNGAWGEGGANFFFARTGRQAWSYAGSELVDVTFGQGGSLYAYPRARDASGGWWEIDVPPALVAALAIGDQYGLMLCDEKGQTQTRHVFSSREGAHPPELVVEGEPAGGAAPVGVRLLEARKTTRPGSVGLKLSGAARLDLRYSAQPIAANNFTRATAVPRWMIDPLAPKPAPMATANSLGETATAKVENLSPGALYHFAARAMDAAGRTGPVSPLGRHRAFARTFPALPPAPVKTTPPAANPEPRVWAVPELLKVNAKTGALLEQADFPAPRNRNAVWDGATVRLTGARNEFVAFQLAVEAAKASLSVAKPLFASSKLPPVFAKSGAAHIYREWFVPDEKNEWFPDALVPVEIPFEQAVPGQTVYPYFVDIFIPHDAAPGRHTGSIAVRGAGLSRDIPIEIEVLPLRLPDKLNFVVDLNCYSGVESGFPAQRGTPEYRAIEQAYYRVAHLNRGNLDILGYSHNGSTVADHTPPLTGEGAQTRVADWSAWDAHFGPIAGGSAFADLPRASQPVAALYLPFFENWPGDLRRGYKFNNYPAAKTEEEYREIVTRHTLTAAPVEEAFDREYQERVPAVAAEFARHIRERGWTNTEYCVYFNNKYYYKRPSQGGRGVSWWLLDEPNHRDDVRATSFLAALVKRGLKGHEDVPILLRTDISRVDWIRDLLAGQIDINCISRRFYEKNRYLRDDPVRFGRRFWNYASTNHPRETNVAMRAWCWRAWLAGADGIVPWNTVRGPAAWDRAEPLTVIHAGSKFGRKEPFESLRLKAFRRGQQDIEYLVLLAAKAGWDREAVSRAVASPLDLAAEDKLKYEEDAGAVRFLNVKDADFDTLRLRAARALAGK